MLKDLLALIRKGAYLQLISYDIGILNDLHAGLIARGIECPPVRLHSPAGRLFNNGRYRTQGDAYCLSIHRRAALLALFEQIEPCLKHAKRRADMKTAWEHIRSRGLSVDYPADS